MCAALATNDHQYLKFQESWETEAILFPWVDFIYAVLYFYILFQLHLQNQ